jgi:hypothetical protein
MPVIGAFPAAQGEPESFLAILGSMRCLQKILLTPIFLLLRDSSLRDF